MLDWLSGDTRLAGQQPSDCFYSKLNEARFSLRSLSKG
ncbi:hypothetical protein PMI27_004710 [Pseudomonas sp. GM41(2012)]|nr:hypothetical protein PMI27_004710 [Pseudomonas sp. GM41(2012)]